MLQWLRRNRRSDGALPHLPLRVSVESEPDTHAVPAGVRAAADWSWRLVVVTVAIATLIYLLSHVTVLVYPLVIGVMLSTLLRPMTVRLIRLGVPNSVAATLVFVTGLALVVLVLSVLIATVSSQFEQISGNVVDGIDKVRGWLAQGPLHMRDEELTALLNDLKAQVQVNRERIASGALSTVFTIGEVGAGLVLTLFVTFFFTHDGDQIWRWVVRLFPRKVERDLSAAGGFAWQALTAIVRGTVIVAAVDAVAITVLLLVLGIPLAVPLGAIVFFGSFIPIVGSLLAGAIAVLVALVVKGWVIALVVLAGLIVVMQLEGHVLQPLIMGRMVKIHPLAIVLVVSAGTLLAGIGGALIAVPLVAVVKVAFEYFVGGRRGSEAPPAVETTAPDAGLAAAPTEPPAPGPDRDG